MAIPTLAEQINKLDVPEGVKSALTLAAGAAVGAATGGEAGALAATNQVENNYLKHKELEALRDELKNCEQRSCSAAERQKILERYAQLSAKNDADLAACVTQACVDGHMSSKQEAKALQASVLKGLGGQAGQELVKRQTTSPSITQQYKIDSDRKTAAVLNQQALSNCVIPQPCESKVAGLVMDFIPVVGDVKGFMEAETALDYTFAAIGVLGPIGDAAKSLYRSERVVDAVIDTKKVADGAAAGREATRLHAPEKVADTKTFPPGTASQNATGHNTNYSGDVFDSNFVGPVKFDTFYRGDSTRRVDFLSSMAESRGVPETNSFLSSLDDASYQMRAEYHSWSSEGSTFISVTPTRALRNILHEGRLKLALAGLQNLKFLLGTTPVLSQKIISTANLTKKSILKLAKLSKSI